jgi:hypothetical protein
MKISKLQHMIMLSHDDDGACWYIIKSGHEDQYLVVFEDPFDLSVTMRNSDEVVALCLKFDESFIEEDLPKAIC